MFPLYFSLKSTPRIKYQYKIIYAILSSNLELRAGKNAPSMAYKVSCVRFHFATKPKRTSHTSAPRTGQSSWLHSVYNTNWKVCVCVCACVVIVTRKLKLHWNFATCSYNVHLDNCFFVNIVRLCFFVNTVLACCYGSNDINRNNSGATNLQGFLFFNGKENSKTKNILFICNYGNTNTRQTQEGCIIGTWEVFYLVVLGKRQSWNGIEVLGCYNLGKRGKNKTKLHSSQKRWYLGGSGSFPDLYNTTCTESGGAPPNASWVYIIYAFIYPVPLIYGF